MHGTESKGNSATNTQERELGFCMLEVMQVIMQGNYPSEQRLELLLDRNGGTA